jgi:hypothetical protein
MFHSALPPHKQHIQKVLDTDQVTGQIQEQDWQIVADVGVCHGT